MAIELQSLPYELDALEPFISAATLKVHYGQHHKGYVDRLNQLIRRSAYDSENLVGIILKSAANRGIPRDQKIYQNSSQAWNHTFFWNCLTNAVSPRTGFTYLSSFFDKHFGSKERFVQEFARKAEEFFGSGWVWLAKSGDQSFEIFCTQNADSPLVYGKTPILVCDVWEHAYYLDYQNDRKGYLQSYWKCVDWNFIEEYLVRIDRAEVDSRVAANNVATSLT